MEPFVRGRQKFGSAVDYYVDGVGAVLLIGSGGPRTFCRRLKTMFHSM